MSEFHARSRRRLSGEAGAAAIAPPPAPSDGTERQRERKKPGRKPATSVLCQVGAAEGVLAVSVRGAVGPTEWRTP